MFAFGSRCQSVPRDILLVEGTSNSRLACTIQVALTQVRAQTTFDQFIPLGSELRAVNFYCYLYQFLLLFLPFLFFVCFPLYRHVNQERTIIKLWLAFQGCLLEAGQDRARHAENFLPPSLPPVKTFKVSNPPTKNIDTTKVRISLQARRAFKSTFLTPSICATSTKTKEMF